MTKITRMLIKQESTLPKVTRSDRRVPTQPGLNLGIREQHLDTRTFRHHKMFLCVDPLSTIEAMIRMLKV